MFFRQQLRNTFPSTGHIENAPFGNQAKTALDEPKFRPIFTRPLRLVASRVFRRIFNPAFVGRLRWVTVSSHYE